jgi:hypothetical protein
MAQSCCYEQYPLRVVLISNSLSFATYLIGGFLILQLNFIFLLIYLLFIVTLEVRVLRRSCTGCYYFGKRCAFGKGKISALLFDKKDTKGLGQAKITWKSVVPDFLASLIPMVVGIGLLLVSFDPLILALVLALALLSSIGNGVVRGSYACKFCKQREIGCPAEKLFSKNKSKS